MNRTGRIALAVLPLVGLTACSDDGDAADAVPPIVAQVASYEPVAGLEQRFMVGVPTSGDGGVIGFGEVSFEFGILPDGENVPSSWSEPVAASYNLVAGQVMPADPPPGPAPISPSEGRGVYSARVTFDQPGLWVVRVAAELPSGRQQAEATFEVFDRPLNPFPGEPAPLTKNRLAGDPSVPASAIDSRAFEGDTVPDPELHAVTVADTVAAGRPFMLVVSTPTYCISQFCGPITEQVELLAEQYDDRMAFIHAEVWNDFEAQALNQEAADWIYQNGADPKEPWVFVVDADGIIRYRFDNVASNAELQAAIDDVLA